MIHFWLNTPHKVSKEKDFLGICPELCFWYPAVWRHKCFCVDYNNINQRYFTLFMCE